MHRMTWLLGLGLSLALGASAQERVRTGTVAGERGYYFINHRDTRPTEGGFVSYQAHVAADAGIFIGPGATVLGSASIEGDARIYGEALVEDAEITGSARVYGSARVIGNVVVRNDARIFGQAFVHTGPDEQLSIGDQAQVYGNAEVSGNVLLLGDARVAGNAVVRGDAVVGGTAFVKGDTVIESGEVLSGVHDLDGTPPEIALHYAWYEHHFELTVFASEPLAKLRVGSRAVDIPNAGPATVRLARGPRDGTVEAEDAFGNQSRVELVGDPWGEASEAQSDAARERELPVSITTAGLELALIPPGRFKMGSPPGEEGRKHDESRHEVRLERPFYIARTEVPAQLFGRLMGRASEEDEELPAVHVTWYDALAFCNELSAREGLEPAYTLSDVHREGGSIVSASVEFHGLDCEGYRLPTEAEWEYACRSGTVGARYGEADAVAWHHEIADGRPHPVATKLASPWGLHDMLGNVWEWCWDGYAAYGLRARTDPVTSDGRRRVARGGSWGGYATNCRAAVRSGNDPAEASPGLGFRPARSCP